MLVLICPGLSSSLWRPVHPWLQRNSSPVLRGDFSCVHSVVSRIQLPSGPKVWTSACTTKRRWLGFPQQPAEVRCPDCLQGRSATIPQAPFKFSRKKPKAAWTRCPAGSSTPKSNPLSPEGMQKTLLLPPAS